MMYAICVFVWVCVCMWKCVCMRVCVFVCGYVFMCESVYVCNMLCTHDIFCALHMYVRMCMSSACIHMYVVLPAEGAVGGWYIHTYIHTYIHIYIRAHTYIHAYTHTSAGFLGASSGVCARAAGAAEDEWDADWEDEDLGRASNCCAKNFRRRTASPNRCALDWGVKRFICVCMYICVCMHVCCAPEWHPLIAVLWIGV
jgi:hypothetical protein